MIGLLAKTGATYASLATHMSDEDMPNGTFPTIVDGITCTAYINMLEFWQVPNIPDELIDYIMINDMSGFNTQHTVYNTIVEILNTKNVYKATELGYINCLSVLSNIMHLPCDLYKIGAEYNQIRCIEFIYENTKYVPSLESCNVALGHNNIECFKYLVELTNGKIPLKEI
jgi:hypothetical protein